MYQKIFFPSSILEFFSAVGKNFWNNYIFYLFLGILGPLCSQGPPRFSYLSSSSGPKKTPLQRPTTQSNNLNFFKKSNPLAFEKAPAKPLQEKKST